MNRIEVIARASNLHQQREIARLKKDLLAGIRAFCTFELHEVETPSNEALTAVLVLSGGVEREVLKLVSQLPSPTLLIAHSGHNSLPACLEILARVRQDGGEGQILFGSPETIARKLSLELQVVSAWERLRFSRVGLIGTPSEWLVASDLERAFLKGRLGIELVQIEMKELVERIASTNPSKKDVARFTKAAQEEVEPSKEELHQAVAVYTTLHSLVKEHRLAAFTVRCFDLVSQLKNTGCYALSRFNDERIPAGCEGDLQALFSLYLAVLLSGKAAFMGNIASVDPVTGKLILAHCSCPLSLGTRYAIRSHFESGLGVGIAVAFSDGPCTLFRLGGVRLDHLFICQGEIEGSSERDDLCRTQVTISATDPVSPLLTAPLGNHHILAPGHHREALELFFERYLRR